ncbi:unnamed protein product [Arctia plantaginis]|nr:unnamed protein product [Arctia plantaginis]
MLSQVERKYEIETPLNVKHRDLTLDEEIKEAVEKKKKEKSKTSLVDEDLFDMNTNSKPAKEEKHQDLQHVAPQTAYVSTTRKPTTRKKFNWAKYYEELEDIKDIKNYYHNYTKTPKTRWWWPIEYGWEIDYAWYF